MDKDKKPIVPHNHTDIPPNIRGLLEGNSEHGEMLLKMIKDENAHRHTMDIKEMDFSTEKLAIYKNEKIRLSKRETRNSWMVFSLSILVILGTVFLIYNDKEIEGIIFGGVALIVGLTNYFTKKKKPPESA